MKYVTTPHQKQMSKDPEKKKIAWKSGVEKRHYPELTFTYISLSLFSHRNIPIHTYYFILVHYGFPPSSVF